MTSSDQKPKTFNGNLRNLPAALEPLTSLPYWVLWRWEKNNNGDWTKVPYQPSGRKAKNNDPATWSTYDAVVAVTDRFDGIGFVLPDHGAFDLDHCRDPVTGTIAPWAQELIGNSGSYTEITVSGTGLRIIGTTANDSKEVHRKWPIANGMSLEAYRRTRRYITISGNPLNGSPSQLVNIDDVIDAVVAERNAARAAPSPSSGGATDIPAMLQPMLYVVDGGKGKPHCGYATRSELLYAFVNAALRARVSEETIVAACLDGAHAGHAIFEHCQGQSGGASRYVAKQIEHARRDAINKDVADINAHHALVLAGNKAAIMKFEGDAKFRLIQVEAFKQWYANRWITINNDRVEVAKYWLGHSQRRQYEGIEFAPGSNRNGYYNLWRGFTVEPREGDCSKFLAHLRDNVAQGNEFLYKWIVGWFAQIMQQLTVKTGTCLALRGKQGVGKTIVGKVFGSLIADHYALVADPRYITGQFNSHMASLLLLHADEAFWAGDKRSEGKLKDLITGERHFLEFKGIDPISIQNRIRLFVTGNQDWLVPAGFGERRFAVIDVGEKHKEDHAYFAAIEEEMNNGGREALLHHLLNFDLSQVNLRLIPKTEALLEQIIETATPEQAWWLDTLKRGELPWGVLDQDNNNATCVKNTCPKRTLFRRYIQHANLQGARRKAIETKIGMFLNKYVGPVLVSDQKKKYSVYHRNGRKIEEIGWVYTFPSLAYCREQFAKEMQQGLSWPNAEVDWTHEIEQVEDENIPF